MKSIQSINLFFTDNFNRYIDNILVCELIDAFLDFNEFFISCSIILRLFLTNDKISFSKHHLKKHNCPS